MKNLKKIFFSSLLVLISSLTTIFLINVALEIAFRAEKKEEIYRDLLAVKYGKRESTEVERLEKAAAKRGIKYDRRHHTQYIEDERKRGERITKSIGPQYYANKKVFDQWREPYFPPGDASGIRVVLSNENGYFADFFSDRHGFNNPDDVWEKIEKGETIDVVLVGDSYAQGYSVEPHQNIAGVLRSKNLSVLNLGRGGNGPLSSLAAYIEYGKNVKARFVVYLHFDANDLRDISWERQSDLLMRYVTDADFEQGLRKRDQHEIDKDILALWEVVSRYEKRKLEEFSASAGTDAGAMGEVKNMPDDDIRDLASEVLSAREADNVRYKNQNPTHRITTLYHIRMLLKPAIQKSLPCNGNWRRPDTEALSRNFSILESVITRMSGIATKDGGKFLFVSNPDRGILFGSAKRSTDGRICTIHDYKPLLLSALRGKGINVLNFEPVLKAVDDKSALFPLGGPKELGIVMGHFNPRGYALFADTIFNKLNEIGKGQN